MLDYDASIITDSDRQNFPVSQVGEEVSTPELPC